MKNYKLLNFNKEKLKEMGFHDCLFDTMYKKTYIYNYPYSTISLVITKGKEHIHFYRSRFFLPCELESEIGKESEKKLKKEMSSDLKELKRLNIISK